MCLFYTQILFLLCALALHSADPFSASAFSESESAPFLVGVCDDLMDASALSVCPQSASMEEMRRLIANLQMVIDNVDLSQDMMEEQREDLQKLEASMSGRNGGCRSEGQSGSVVEGEVTADAERTYASESLLEAYRYISAAVAEIAPNMDRERSEDKRVIKFEAIDIFERGARTPQYVNTNLLNDLICVRGWDHQAQRNYRAKKKGIEVTPVPQVSRYDIFNLLERELDRHPKKDDRSAFDICFRMKVDENVKIRDSARNKGKVRTVAALDAALSDSQTGRNRVTSSVTNAAILKEALEAEMTYLSHKRKRTSESVLRCKKNKCVQKPKRSLVEEGRVVEEESRVARDTLFEDSIEVDRALSVGPECAHMMNVGSLEELLVLANSDQGTLNASLVCGTMPAASDDEWLSSDSDAERTYDSESLLEASRDISAAVAAIAPNVDRERSEHEKIVQFASLDILEKHKEQGKQVSPFLVQDIKCLRSWFRQQNANRARKRWGHSPKGVVPSVLRYDKFNLLERELQRHKDNMSVFAEHFRDMVTLNAKMRDQWFGRMKARTLDQLDEAISKCVRRENVTNTITNATVLQDALYAEMLFLSNIRQITRKSIQTRRKQCTNSKKTKSVLTISGSTRRDDKRGQCIANNDLALSQSTMNSDLSEDNWQESIQDRLSHAPLVRGSMSDCDHCDPPSDSEEHREYERSAINFDDDLLHRLTEEDLEFLLRPKVSESVFDNVDLSQGLAAEDLEVLFLPEVSESVFDHVDLSQGLTAEGLEPLFLPEVSESVPANDDLPQDMMEEHREDLRRPEASMSGKVVVGPMQFTSLDILERSKRNGKEVSPLLITDLQDIRKQTQKRIRLYDKFDFLIHEMKRCDRKLQKSKRQCFDEDFRNAVDRTAKLRLKAKTKNFSDKYKEMEKVDVVTDPLVLKKAMEAEMNYIAWRRGRRDLANGGRRADRQLDCVIEGEATADADRTDSSESLLGTSTLKRDDVHQDISAAVAARESNMDRDAREDVERLTVFSVGNFDEYRHNKTGVAKPSE
ncbi:MAG: hypothetical protein OXC30_06865, partial [Alphaproteobacteria bacterium]|nr:hypothetical protein [Alphaproteobacteria bacterium]